MPQYRIRDNNTGLYSTGGNAYNISWTKIGKVWTSLGNLRNHLAQMPCIPDHWVVEECALVCTAVIPHEQVAPKPAPEWRKEYDEKDLQQEVATASKKQFGDGWPGSSVNQTRRYLLAFHPDRWDGLVEGEPWKPI